MINSQKKRETVSVFRKGNQNLEQIQGKEVCDSEKLFQEKKRLDWIRSVSMTLNGFPEEKE